MGKLRPYLIEAIIVITVETVFFVWHGFWMYFAYTLFTFLFFTKGLFNFSGKSVGQSEASEHMIAWFLNPLIFLCNVFLVYSNRNKYKYLKKRWLQISLVKTYKALCNVKSFHA